MFAPNNPLAGVPFTRVLFCKSRSAVWPQRAFCCAREGCLPPDTCIEVGLALAPARARHQHPAFLSCISNPVAKQHFLVGELIWLQDIPSSNLC